MAAVVNAVTPKYRRIATAFYMGGGDGFDYSDQALTRAYEYETFGTRHDLTDNGYVFGKKAFDITVAAWREDLALGLICKHELVEQYEDDQFLHDFVWEIIRCFPVAPLFGHLS